MKVIKRDGRAVEYNKEKIVIAIEKANKEVRESKRATKEEIEQIISYIEELGKKRMLVEDIQDIIEEKLMRIGKYELSKKYIVYRYTRALVRKQNTTDKSILGLIKTAGNDMSTGEANKNTIMVSIQRDLIAGEVSKDLTKRMLLPEKIIKADEEGILQFHDMEYFLQPIFNSCLINLADMLDNGLVINGELIESPKSFQVACIVMTQIIATVARSQYGGQTIDVSHLGKYLRKSKEKFEKELGKIGVLSLSNKDKEKLLEARLKSELTAGIQTIQYQINTLMTTNGQAPFVTLFLNLKEDDLYAEENAMIIEEILNQRYQGKKNKEGKFVTLIFPKLIYVLDKHNALEGGKYDYLTELAIKCSAKRLSPDYISAKKMRENYEGNVFAPMGDRYFLSPWKNKNGDYKFEGRFNQGVVSLNLPQIAIIANGDEEAFWRLLEERLELCHEALMCRHYALLGVTADISPIHWKYGAIARLESGERIDELLQDGYSTLSLGYIGLYEITKLMKGVSHTEQQGYEFAIKVMKKLKDTTEKWKKESGLGFTLYATPSKKIADNFAKIDRERFGEIKDITDKGYYTDSYHVDLREKMDVFSKLEFESKFQSMSLGGAVSCIEISNKKLDLNDMENIVKCIYNNTQYVNFV